MVIVSSLTEICLASVAATFTYITLTLIYPILYPTIITYPWPTYDDDEYDATRTVQKKTVRTKRKQQQRRTKEKNQCVVLAGSFNPPHNGHLGILLYLAERYGKVIVVVGMNPNKEYLVTPTERADLVRRMIQNTSAASNVRVEVVAGYIWRKVKPMGATLFVRGIRSWDKDGVDERSLQILNTWGPILYGPLWFPLPTIFIEGKPQYNHVSSTLIRTIISIKKTIISNNQSTSTDNSAISSSTSTTTNRSRSIGNNDDANIGSNDELLQLVPSCIVEDVARLYSR